MRWQPLLRPHIKGAGQSQKFGQRNHSFLALYGHQNNTNIIYATFQL